MKPRPAPDVPSLLPRVRAALVAVADPDRAPAMQAYMKSTMPFHGVSAPVFYKAMGEFFAGIEIPDAHTWRAQTLDLWRSAAYREERYAATAFTADRRARIFQTLESLPMYEEMIVTGAWWDHVDTIAVHRLDVLLRHEGARMKRILRTWSRSTDLWKRRSAILCQNTAKSATDLTLLHDCLEPSLDSPEFFLRKAIGWALRELAWTNPNEVIRYVREHRAQLSGLSKREALKNLIRRGLVSKEALA